MGPVTTVTGDLHSPADPKRPKLDDAVDDANGDQQVKVSEFSVSPLTCMHVYCPLYMTMTSI